MTKRVFEEDVYKKELEATVIESKEIDGYTYIELNETIFFPEGGGQSADEGTINGFEVLDVQENKEDKEKIIHKLKEKIEVGEKVTCKLNWEKRLDQMQQHCGEHILSGVIMKLYKGVNKGFRMGEDYVTIDMDVANMTEEMIEEVEKQANQAVFENRIVKAEFFESKEEANKKPLRKAITVDENVRVVTIEETDCVACCGTHPTRTGDVGLIKILKAENYKGMTRIYFKCGNRALKDYKAKHDIVTNLNKKYSAQESNLLERIEKEKEKFETLKEENNRLKKIINEAEVNELLKLKESVIVRIYEDKSFDDINNIAKKLMEESSSLVIMASSEEKRVLVCHNGESEIHVGKIFKENIKEFEGRGGGSLNMAQGAFSDLNKLNQFVECVKNKIS